MNIALDSGPVGLLTTSIVSKDSIECERWMEEMSAGGHLIFLPEIVVYEIRRELLRINSKKGLLRLQTLNQNALFLAVNSPAMDKEGGGILVRCSKTRKANGV